MDGEARRMLTEAAAAVLRDDEMALLRLLTEFTDERLATAEEGVRTAGSDSTDRHLHACLRECWDALDGLGREANLIMGCLFPEAGLYPPFEMSRQCTFYMVRKLLRECDTTRERPLARLLWDETRDEPASAYRLLSFLRNLSLFVPIRAEGGLLPGADTVPEPIRPAVKPQEVAACPVDEGLSQIAGWLAKLVAQSRRLMAAALYRANR